MFLPLRTAYRGEDLLTAVRALDIPAYRQILPRFAVELRRARRYQHPLSLVIVGAEGPAPLFAEEAGAGRPPAVAPLAPVPSALLTYFLLGSFLRNALRETDILASTAEDLLYVVLMPETDEAGARQAVERLRRGLSGATPLRLGAGIAEFPPDGFTVEDLLERARRAFERGDTARAKEASRA